MERAGPGVALTIAALIFAFAGVQSVLKPFSTGPDAGFMLFGYRTDGLLEAVASGVHAVLMFALAYGIWRLKRYALYVLLAYTPYILLNLILFSLRYDWPSPLPAPLFPLLYALIALGVPGATAALLARRRLQLGA